MDTRAQGSSADLRRAALTVAIASFGVAALMGIAALLSGGSFGETEVRVLLTTVVSGCGSLAALCCLVVLGSRFQGVGVTGLLVVLGTTLFTLLLVWGGADIDSSQVVRAWGVCVTASASLAQTCLLLGGAGRRASLGFLIWVTAGLVALLALLVSAMILGWDGGEGTWRLVGVVAILDVLGTLVAISLGVFGRDHSATTSAGLTVTVPGTAAERLRTRSRETGRPVADLVGEALSRYLEPSAD